MHIWIMAAFKSNYYLNLFSIFQTVKCDFDINLRTKLVILILQAMQNFVWNFAVFLVAFASFTTYSLSVSDTLSVGTAFVSLGKL